MKVDLRKLKQLVTIAELGSFSRAAEELHISQPALSRSIAGIEKEYGIRIFERGRHGAALTPAGKLAIQDAEVLLRRARTLEHNFELYGRGNAGRVAFGMGPMVASMILPTLSRELMSQPQRLNIHAAVQSTPKLLDDLKHDRIEMIFCGMGQFDGSADTHVEIIGTIPMAMLVRTQHPLAQFDGPIPSHELFRYPILSAVELANEDEQRGSGSFICDNYDILKNTVLSTDSVWVSTPRMVQDEIDHGLITSIEISDLNRPLSADICLAYMEGSSISPAANAIARFVKDYFSKQINTE